MTKNQFLRKVERVKGWQLIRSRENDYFLKFVGVAEYHLKGWALIQMSLFAESVEISFNDAIKQIRAKAKKHRAALKALLRLESTQEGRQLFALCSYSDGYCNQINLEELSESVSRFERVFGEL